jgi:hypothetical protein
MRIPTRGVALSGVVLVIKKGIGPGVGNPAVKRPMIYEIARFCLFSVMNLKK